MHIIQIPRSCEEVVINLFFLVYFPFLSASCMMLASNTYAKASLTPIGRLLVRGRAGDILHVELQVLSGLMDNNGTLFSVLLEESDTGRATSCQIAAD